VVLDRALTSTEITQLYNGGTGITYDSLDNDAPIVTQISPANNAKESTTGSKNLLVTVQTTQTLLQWNFILTEV